MVNKIFDDISMEELNEMLNNLPNDFDTENKIEKRIINKTMRRINSKEATYKRKDIFRAITIVAAICVMVIAVMWAVGFDNVSAYVKKTFFTPGMDSFATDGDDVVVETTPSEVIAHKIDEYMPIVLKEPVSVSNENGTFTLVNATSSNIVIKEMMSGEEIDNTQNFSGITLNMQIKLNADALANLKETYKDDLYYDFAFAPDTKGNELIHNYKNYNFAVLVNGKEYNEIGRSAYYTEAFESGHSLKPDEEYNVYFDGWAIIVDDADIAAGKTYTLTVDHELFGKFSLDFVLENADELGVGGSHETLSVMHNGITITAIKYETEVNGKKYVAVDTSVDDSAFPYDVMGGVNAQISSYVDENMNEKWVAFKKSDGTLISPVDWSDNTYYFDAEKIEAGDDFIVPGLAIQDLKIVDYVNVESISVPIPENGKTIKDDIVFEFALGDLIIDKVKVSEDYSYRDTVIEGEGLLMDMKWKPAEGLDGMILMNVQSQCPTPEDVEAYRIQPGIDGWVTTGYMFDEEEPYFIKIKDTDKDNIELTMIFLSAFLENEYRFDF